VGIQSFIDHLLTYGVLQLIAAVFGLLNIVGVLGCVVRIRRFIIDDFPIQWCEATYVSFLLFVQRYSIVGQDYSDCFKLNLNFLKLHVKRVARNIEVRFAASLSFLFFFIGLELLKQLINHVKLVL
jgi:hypothetical protein